MRWVLAVLIGWMLVGSVHAQGLVFTDPAEVFGPPPGVPYYYAKTGSPVPGNQAFISLALTIPGQPPNGLISVGNLIAASGGVTQPQMSAALTSIASRIDRMNDRFSEGIALAGSFNVLPPDADSRFAVSVGGAGYNGAGAASISVSARINGDTIVYGAVARGPTQTMVKGGMGWQFR